jgi:hypothetical protein
MYVSKYRQDVEKCVHKKQSSLASGKRQADAETSSSPELRRSRLDAMQLSTCHS